MPQITVRYFAAAAEAAGRDEEHWHAPPATLDELRDELGRRYGDPMRKVLRSGSFLVDGTVRRDDGEIRGALVDVLPPFAGG